MIRFHNINGELVSAEQASIFVTDVGLLRGYGIFDFFPIMEGQPLFEEDYFDRFFHSAAKMKLEVPVDRPTLRNRVVELARANGMRQGYTKLVLTGGYAADGFSPGRSNLLILQHGEVKNDPDHYEKGVTLLLQKYFKDSPDVKSIHYANALKHRFDLAEAHAMDLLYHDGRFIRETSRANFFIVDQIGEVHTTVSNVLSGVTRKHVLNAARENDIKVHEGPLPLDAILEAVECFITSTTKGVLPVSKVNNRLIGSGIAGPLSRHLQACFEKYTEAFVRKNLLSS